MLKFIPSLPLGPGPRWSEIAPSTSVIYGQSKLRAAWHRSSLGVMLSFCPISFAWNVFWFGHNRLRKTRVIKRIQQTKLGLLCYSYRRCRYIYTEQKGGENPDTQLPLVYNPGECSQFDRGGKTEQVKKSIYRYAIWYPVPAYSSGLQNRL